MRALDFIIISMLLICIVLEFIGLIIILVKYKKIEFKVDEVDYCYEK